MKRKFVAVAICGVIGVMAMASSFVYRKYKVKEETQTLVEIPKKEEVDTKNSEMEKKKQVDLNKSIKAFKEDVQSENSVENNNLDIVNKEPIKDGQGSVEHKEESRDNKTFKVDGSVNENETEANKVSPSVEEDMFNEQIEQLIFNKVNEERVKARVPKLNYNLTMETYARVKSKDMGIRNYFDHLNTEGELITATMARDGIGYNAWGENIAYISGISDFTALADQFMSNWMNSEEHKANILSTNFESVGIGVYKKGERYYATQEFYK